MKRFFAVAAVAVQRGRPLAKLLVKNSPAKNNTHLKKRLIREGLLSNRCYQCGMPPLWQNKPLTLEIDHINGDNRDNTLENLRILCLNCHSQTPYFRRFKEIVRS
jgi:5-methylcytosine-specific restriction endonuclease McrA